MKKCFVKFTPDAHMKLHFEHIFLHSVNNTCKLKLNFRLTCTENRMRWDPADCSKVLCHRHPHVWPASYPHLASSHGCCTGKPPSSSLPAAVVETALGPLSPPRYDHTNVWKATNKTSLALISTIPFEGNIHLTVQNSLTFDFTLYVEESISDANINILVLAQHCSCVIMHFLHTVLCLKF